MRPDGSDYCKVGINVEQLDDSTGDVAFEKNLDWLVPCNDNVVDDSLELFF